MPRPRDHRTLFITWDGEFIVMHTTIILLNGHCIRKTTRCTQNRRHPVIYARCFLRISIYIRLASHRTAFCNRNGVLADIHPNCGSGLDAIAMKKTVTGKPQFDWPRCRNDRRRRIVCRNEFFFLNSDSIQLVFTNELIRSPSHACWLWIFENFAIDHDTTV